MEAKSEDRTCPVKFKVPQPPPPRKPSDTKHKKPSTRNEAKEVVKKRIQVIPSQQKEEEEEEEWEESEPQIVPDKLNSLSTQLPNLSVSNEDFKKNDNTSSSIRQETSAHYKIITSSKPLTTPTSSRDRGEEGEPHYKIVTRSYKEPLPTFSYKKKEPIYDEIPEKEKSLVEIENTSDKSKFTRQTSNEEEAEKEPLYDTIPRQPILTSATKDRPRPPTTRRHPSVSPSQSMSLISEESEHSYANIGADGNVFLEGSDSEGEGEDKKVLSLSVSR